MHNFNSNTKLGGLLRCRAAPSFLGDALNGAASKLRPSTQNGRYRLRHAVQNVDRGHSKLQCFQESSLYHKVMQETGLGGPSVRTLQQQYDSKTIETFLQEVLKDFEKEARRYKISRTGAITESRFAASDPPKTYPDMLTAFCGWENNVWVVSQISNGLMVHFRETGPTSRTSGPTARPQAPFYPRVTTPQAGPFWHIKPGGMYFAFGTNWMDWQTYSLYGDTFEGDEEADDAELASLKRDFRCREYEAFQWMRDVGRLPEAEPKDNTVSSYDESLEITNQGNKTEVITLSVRPDAFTWTIDRRRKTDQILVIDCKEQWEAVQKLFRLPIAQLPSYLSPPIDWQGLAKCYAGIDIRTVKNWGQLFNPTWISGWDVVGPCIWDFAAVEAELEVRTCDNDAAAYHWVKAQEAKATSTTVLLDHTSRYRPVRRLQA